MSGDLKHNGLRAIVWDFDGTLIDTRQRNLSVNRRIIEQISDRPVSEFPSLDSVESYDEVVRRVQNWRELYMDEFGLTPEQTERAARLWTSLQRDDDSPVRVFEGVRETLLALRAVPHGIFSQNSREHIETTLAEVGLAGWFQVVIGYEEVARDRQKPAPDGLIRCVDQLLEGDDGLVLFVGDHPVDAQCVYHANEFFASEARAVRSASIAACFSGDCDAEGWEPEPHFVARSPRDVVEIAAAEVLNPPKV